MDAIQRNLLREVIGMEKLPKGAYSLRVNGESADVASTANIEIVKKEDKPGIDIYIKPGTKNESMHIPVILAETGLKDLVYNDFHIGEDADVVIVAGCGISNCGAGDSEHSGIHSFYLAKNAKLKYIEKHVAMGDGKGSRILNPVTHVEMEEGSYMEMETTQIRGVDSTKRVTTAKIGDHATLIVNEKIMTHGEQFAHTDFVVDLDGEGSSTHVVSRAVAKDDSKQSFVSDMRGNNACEGRTECDAIIMDQAYVTAEPKIVANHPDASLVHEAAIGKIAGEQLIKLMTLGLSEKEAEEAIVAGFLK